MEITQEGFWRNCFFFYEFNKGLIFGSTNRSDNQNRL